jgi:hypothetical protein
VVQLPHLRRILAPTEYEKRGRVIPDQKAVGDLKPIMLALRFVATVSDTS